MARSTRSYTIDLIMHMHFALALLLAVAAARAHAQNSTTFGSLDAYGTLQSGGVVATIGGDANSNASAALEWRPAGTGAFLPGHPLIRVDATHFVGSLFWLNAGHAYEARVTLSDPDGAGTTPVRTSTFSTRAEAGTFVPTRTLYVAPSGSDAHDGSSPAQAVQTIQRGADLADPGDLVSIAAGVYRESVNVPTSGTPSQPIVFRGSSGAILDGADAAIAAGVTWAAGTQGVWSHATGFPTALVVSDQGRLFPYSSMAELVALAAGAPGGFYFDGTTLYLKFSDGSTPAQRQLHVARLAAGFTIDGKSDIRIENLEIRHYGSDEFGKGIYLRYASECSVRGNTIHENLAAGVWLKGGERHLIEDNDISDTSIANWPWAITHESSAQNSTILFTNETGRGNVVRRNHLHGTYDGLHPCGDDPPPSGFSSETDVYENTIDHDNDDAIESEGYCSNVRLWSNHINDTLMAFAIAPAGTGPVWILRNTAYNLGSTHSALVDGYTSSVVKINSDYPEPVGPTLLYHNTVLTTVPGTDAMVLLTPGYSTRLVSRNNVYASAHRALTKVNTIALDFDYDDLYAPGGPSLVRWYGTDYATLAALQAGVGQELHGVSVAPALVDPAHGDFTPTATSGLIDRAVPIPGINDRYAGAAPDLGAIERDDLIFADGFGG